MHVDSTPGSVKISGRYRDAAEARTLAQEQADRAAEARASDASVRWVAPQYAAADMHGGLANEGAGDAAPPSIEDDVRDA